MNTSKTLLTNISRIPKFIQPIKSISTPLNTRKMSLFPRFPASEFAPVFRLLDDYDAHRTNKTRHQVHGFQPKFDVREIKNAYELHGELPGLDRKDVNIEFSDPNTLVVSGRVDREVAYGNEGEGDAKARKVTVEDDDEDESNKKLAPTSGTVAAKSKSDDEPTYWVTERSHGEFNRSFSFPSRVDQDNVKASLKDGILSITVPKAAAHQSRKVNID